MRNRNPPYYLTAYGLAVQQGFKGTLGEWLESLIGDKGAPGDKVEFRSAGGFIWWRWIPYDGLTEDAEASEDYEWKQLVSLVEIRGEVLDDAVGQLNQVVSKLLKDVATLQYDVIGPIDVTGISATPSVAELGSTVDSVTVTWTVNREPVSQTVAGEAVEADDRSAVVPGPFTGTTSFEVVATDERGATDTASTKISFLNGIYYGPLASGVVPDSAAILGLTRKLQSGKGATISYTPTDGKRPSYACPTSYGTPKFVIGGFEYAWTRLGTIQFENASGHKETYGVWQHPQDVTAAMTITVS